jgi:S-DNA-T family DNA segregation ATPase FtsK/SpoIIIE
MAKEKEESPKKNSKTKKGTENSKPFFTDERIKFLAGILITGFAIYLLLACISYLFYWKFDDSLANADVVSGAEIKVRNWSGKSGQFIARYLVAFGFGYGAFFIPLIFGTAGLYLLKFPKIRPLSLITKFSFATILLSLILSLIFGEADGYLKSGPGGAQGYFITEWLKSFMGTPGTAVAVLFFTVVYLIFALKVKPETFINLVKPLGLLFHRKPKPVTDIAEQEGSSESDDNEEVKIEDNEKNDDNPGEIVAVAEEENEEEIMFTVRNLKDQPEEEEIANPEDEPAVLPVKGSIIHDFENDNQEVPEKKEEVPLNISRPEVEDVLTDKEVEKIMENYDPRLDLSRYKFPPVSILREHKSETAFDNSEVFENKENIIKTLADYKISIKSISATIGPTVTLYEIVPERGVKIARIKSLEDDIALNLSALGIRIIAPIPGRGTVGIEVPNKKPEMVSMRSLITSKAFQETKFDIALALGRTITNEPYIVDLTKMPHLLVAGATGQGKSVGINAIITSILYKKHPAELKFVLIDPKRVELPLYAKIERHFLAKLPGEEDAIITDTQKVINTLNSLCIEMDNRLELLKGAQSRNIKEYNEKFIGRKLNPEKGHKFLPYIVLIIDEFADLIMTAGREIEGPIGRLAQLARAIGIHLIISTQRPSANIITGFIKANFPTRVAFRVFSSVDSRTILDATGADRLVGRGDMLISSGNEPVRVQCAFIDTPEIEELTEFIGGQQGYPDAMHLPEYVDDSESSGIEVDLKKRDPMFEEAAKLVVQHQQGSTSLIQRKLSIGYNRAGRIIDQLEAAGVVGPFEGSKARDVLCSDFISLEQILKSLE